MQQLAKQLQNFIGNFVWSAAYNVCIEDTANAIGQ